MFMMTKVCAGAQWILRFQPLMRVYQSPRLAA
jgi:hypothetical protein